MYGIVTSDGSGESAVFVCAEMKPAFTGSPYWRNEVGLTELSAKEPHMILKGQQP
jgi:hypothetical protein